MPLLTAHRHLRVQCLGDDEGIRRARASLCSSRAKSPADGPLGTLLLLLPAQVQIQVSEVRGPAMSAADVLDHDTRHLPELLPCATCDATALRSTALQLDRSDVFHAVLHRLCGRGVV